MYDRVIISLFCCIVICSFAPAGAQTVTLGQASISLDLDLMGEHQVQIEDPLEDFHKSPKEKFYYTIYPATVTSDAGQIILELHVLEEALEVDSWLLEHCIEESDLAPYEMQSEPMTFDGHSGVLVKGFSDSGGNDPRYLASFSPDGDSGWGKIFLIVGSDLPWDSSAAIFDTLQVET